MLGNGSEQDRDAPSLLNFSHSQEESDDKEISVWYVVNKAIKSAQTEGGEVND